MPSEWLFQQQSALFSQQQNFKIKCTKNEVLPDEYVFLKSILLASSICQNISVKENDIKYVIN
jgi:hypothetical protein